MTTDPTTLDDLLAAAGPTQTNLPGLGSADPAPTIEGMLAAHEQLERERAARIAELREKAKSGRQEDQIALFMEESVRPEIRVGPGPLPAWIENIDAMPPALQRSGLGVHIRRNPYMAPCTIALVDADQGGCTLLPPRLSIATTELHRPAPEIFADMLFAEMKGCANEHAIELERGNAAVLLDLFGVQAAGTRF